MKLLKNKTFKQILFSLLAACAVTIVIAVIGALNTIDTWVQDAWFQQPKALDGQIILIGIDDKSIEELMAVCLIFSLVDMCFAPIRECITSERPYEVRMTSRYISKVVTVFGHNLYRVRVKLVLWFRHQGALHATDITSDSFTVIDTSNLQDAKIVV